MDFIQIKNNQDVEHFIEKTNALHDGYIISHEYSHGGITKTDGGYFFDDTKTKLSVRILVTSIYDTIVELEFENLSDWQVKGATEEIYATHIDISSRGVTWASESEETMESTYVIAHSMKWRIIE